MTTPLHRRVLRLAAGGVVTLGGALLLSLYAFPSADARPGGGGGRGGGGGARMNVGGSFNGPRSISRPPPSRPPPSRPPVASQRPSPPQSGLAPRPTPPIANAPPGTGAGAPPRPTHPIVIPPVRPDGPGSNPPQVPGVPPSGYYPPYGDVYWPPYPSYWPPPYYDDGYYGTATETTSPPPVDTITNTLPPDCREVGVAGTTYKLCGGTWYAPRFSGNQLVYVVVPPPT